MLIKTIKDYRDKETKEIFRKSDKNPTREVSDERGAELVKLGYAIEIHKKTAQKKSKKEELSEEPAVSEETTEEPAESVEETE